MVSAITRVPIALGTRSYDIVIGPGLLTNAGAELRNVLARPRVFIVSDEVVAALHLATLEHALDESSIAHQAHLVPAGEASKSFATIEVLLDAMLAARVERSTTAIALGGGVVGDLTGFAAAIMLRGIDFVQMPTTLLSQVDSSVGGKTGINTGRGKNLVGAFHQPRLVLADSDVLATLPPREMRAGYAEIVKVGLIGDATFFAWLEANGRAVLARDPAALTEAIATACRAKASIVAEDEREAGRRALLNLGHTFGHALEAESGYGGTLLHGEAVSIGMVMAFRLSAALGYCPPADVARVARHLTTLGLPTVLPATDGARWDSHRLLAHMHQDKKMRDGRLTFVLARGIGDAFLANDVPMEAVAAILDEAVAA
ncbi:MAG: 3-dehydroquinate synthase [Rhodospirillaceae bacterium]|nr:3-dehydroquinate synthase [Rhodospirillaceae bacterium]